MDSQSVSVPGPFKVSLPIAAPLSWAGFRSGIPFLDLISIHNDGDLVARDLTLELSCVPPFFAPFSQPLAPINPAADSAVFKPDLVIDNARVRTLMEATEASVTARILWNGKDVGNTATPLRVLAHNEWIKTLRNDLIAAFVLPNHSCIKELVAEARDLQNNLFGNPSFEGYQSRSPERVTQQAHAIYSAIQKRGVTYLGVPPSFEEDGQKLRFPDSLKQEKQGNCIELATWFAAALEACELKPVVILMKGHAFSGFWLEEAMPDIGSIETDAATIRKLVSTKKLVLVETTASTNRPATHFAEACALGYAKIVDDTFLALVDVSSARAQGIRPLPTQDEPVNTLSAGVPVTTFDAALPSIAVPACITPGQSKARSRIDTWTDSLLDLTLRNDLLGLTLDETSNAWKGLRPKRKGLSLAIPDLADFENAFADGEKFTLSTEPLEIPKGGVTQEFLDYVQKRVDKNVLCVDLGGLDAKPKVRDLWKRHTMGIEERGTSPIHVALGFLKWFESDNSTPRYAPLLLLPTQIERNPLGASFTISAGDGETVFNTALVQKLRNDFKIDLSGLASNLPEDESGIDVERVFYDVTQAVMSLKRFEVVHLAMLGPFEYRKQVMAKDLKDIAGAKETSPNDFLCRLEPRFAPNSRSMESMGGNVRPFARAQDLDDLIPPGDLPLVVDCDSSQLRAVHAAISGRSFVLHGPPGTGKSQTISNMIACLLSAGKRVLFVAEKRAALSVVARRLDRVGLGTACLELHSEKSDPSHVAASLVDALDEVRTEDIGHFDSFARNVTEQRKKLNQFVRLLHTPTPLGKSYYLVSARRHELRDIDAPSVEHPNHLGTTEEEFERRARALQALSRSIGDCGGWSKHPFRASRLTVWTEKKHDAIHALLKDLEDAAQALMAVQATAAKAFACQIHLVEVAPETFVSMAINDDLSYLLADLEAKKLGQESAPAGFLAAGGFANDHGPLFVVQSHDGPGAPTEEKGAHLLDQTVGKVLVQRAKVAAGFGFDPVEHRAGEHGVQLAEVLATEDALGLGAHGKQAAGLEQVLFLGQVFDQVGSLGGGDAAEVGNAGQLFEATLGADGTELQGLRQDLVNQDGPAAVLHRYRFDPTFAGKLDDGHGLQDVLGRLAQEGRVGDLASAAAGAAHSLHERRHCRRGVRLKD
jgi:hypothetical protein